MGFLSQGAAYRYAAEERGRERKAQMDKRVVIMGARGSVPVSGKQFEKYGCATTSVLVRLCGRSIVIDAGSGILALPGLLGPDEKRAELLLSHAHADHLIGLGMCPALMRADFRLDIYGAARGGMSVRRQIGRLLSPPLWPVGTDELPADVRYHTLKESFSLGGVAVESTQGVHSGGVSVFRISGDGVSIVYAGDTNLTEEHYRSLAEFAEGCDLLLCDGQYSDEEWKKRGSFGHSGYLAAARLGRDAGAKRVRIVHHDPFRTDSELDAAAEEVRRICGSADMAREGEEILL